MRKIAQLGGFLARFGEEIQVSRPCVHLLPPNNLPEPQFSAHAFLGILSERSSQNFTVSSCIFVSKFAEFQGNLLQGLKLFYLHCS